MKSKSLILLLILLAVVAGCAKQKVCEEPLPVVHTAFHETSIEQRPVRRVVVLPVENRSGVQAEFLKNFQNSLSASIRQCGKYEVVEIPPHLCPACRYEWIQRGVFPERLLADLYRNYSADGVVFVSVNAYRPYAPISVAATVHVVDTDEGIVLSSVDGNWSVDDPTVKQRMMRKIECDANPHEARILLQSPRFLTDFVTGEIASELGNR